MDIKQLLNDHGIRISGKINITNDIVSVTGPGEEIDGYEYSVVFEDPSITKIPVAFYQVENGVYCRNTKLTTLKNMPKYVGGMFDISYNPHLTSLVGCPTTTYGFNCRKTGITTLEGGPRTVYSVHAAPNTAYGLYAASINKLTTLKHLADVTAKEIWIVNCHDLPINEYKWLLTVKKLEKISTQYEEVTKWWKKWYKCDDTLWIDALTELKELEEIDNLSISCSP
jgi:hypothetical protein